MTMKEKGEILEEIGRLIDDQLEGRSENAFLYSEIAENMGEAYILQDAGDHLIYHLADDEIIWTAHALWKSDPEDKRWQAMRYSLNDGKFSAEFDYFEEEDEDDIDPYRVQRVLKARAGNRKIDYTVAWEKAKHLFNGLDI
jgi:hypothetical protein